MRFSDAVARTTAARALLDRASRDSERWSDDLRQRFDAQRLKPLHAAGSSLETALKKAQQECEAAERLLRQ